jgi:hypothetical protein
VFFRTKVDCRETQSPLKWLKNSEQVKDGRCRNQRDRDDVLPTHRRAVAIRTTQVPQTQAAATLVPIRFHFNLLTPTATPASHKHWRASLVRYF